LLIVTADVVVGTPVGVQLPVVVVSQTFDTPPVAAACAAKGDNARAAVVIRSCLRKFMTSHPVLWSHRKLVTQAAPPEF
jgi:hypothetical protein